jgi:hypothetical protein
MPNVLGGAVTDRAPDGFGGPLPGWLSYPGLDSALTYPMLEPVQGTTGLLVPRRCLAFSSHTVALTQRMQLGALPLT